MEGSHLGVAVCSGQHRDVIGRCEGVPPLLDLPITLPLPPLGSAVLEPDLGAGAQGEGGRVAGGLQRAGERANGRGTQVGELAPGWAILSSRNLSIHMVFRAGGAWESPPPLSLWAESLWFSSLAMSSKGVMVLHGPGFRGAGAHILGF